MNDEALFDATVPVFSHCLSVTKNMLHGIPVDAHVLLEKSLAIHAFTAAEHFETAINFISRTVHPLMDQEIREYTDEKLNCANLLQLANNTTLWLSNVRYSDVDGANERVIYHTAGTADLEQDTTTFVTIFALPNFFFHLVHGFAVLRREGVDIGKSDFDGLHKYGDPDGYVVGVASQPVSS